MSIPYARQGGEFLVNSTIASQQAKPKTAALADGGFVIVWEDLSGLGGDPSNTSIKGQRYDSAGQPVGPEFLINTSTNNGQFNPTVAATANGGFFVAWSDNSGQGGDFDSSIKGQFFDSSGARSGGELLLNTVTTGAQTRPTVETLADGAIAVTWAGPSGNSSLPTSWRTQVFEANGAKRGVETAIDAAGASSGIPAAVTALAGGGYVVAWDSDGYGWARIFDSSGNPIGASFKLSQSVYGAEQYQTLEATPDGGFVVAWAQWAEANRNDIMARRFSATGTPLGDTFFVTQAQAGQQFAPDIAAVPGGYIITWQDGLGPLGQTWDIKGQFYDSNFNRSGNEFFVNQDRPGHQTDSQIIVLSDGKVVITWQGIDGPEDSAGVKAQLLKPVPVPTDIGLSTYIVIETAVENMPFATVSSDGGINSTLTYTYLGDSLGGAFRLEGDRLIVNDSGRLDAETQDNVSVSLRVTNGNGQSYDEVILLEVADSNYEVRYSAGPVTGLGYPVASSETARLANGGFLHLRYELFNSNVMSADIYDPAGTLVGTVSIPAPGARIDGKAAGLANGNFVVAWTAEPANGGGDGNGRGIQAQLFDSAGNVISGVLPVNAVTHEEQTDPSVGALAGGGFVVAWSDSSEFDADVELKAQIFDSAGNKVGAEFMVNDADYQFSQTNSRVAGLANGGFVISWGEGSTSVRAQVYDAAGNRVGGNVTVNTTDEGDQFNHRLAALEGGGFAIAWTDSSQVIAGTGGYVTRAQAFDALGNKVGGEILVDAHPAGNQYGPNIHSTPGGGFVVVWHDQPPVADTDQTLPNYSTLKAQFFDAAGNRMGPTFDVAGEAFRPDTPALAMTDDGDLFVSWNETARRLLAVEHPVVANNDSNTTPENAFVHGNLLANDHREAGAVLQVGAVNGQAANVGETITLSSGATVQVNANGNYTYDPKGAFNHLTGVTGAANSAAADSFTYTLTNGTSATATITVTGIASPGDRALGTPGDDVMTGTAQADFFDLRQGGHDNVNGAGGNDIFYFGRTITGADAVNGGTGIDQLILQGGGGLRFNVGVVGIETITLLSGLDTTYGVGPRNLYGYPLTMVDQNVAAGQRLTIDGSGLRPGEYLTVNGAAERDGSYTIYGGRAADTLTGGAGHDHFVFGSDGHWGTSDRVAGGAGTDELILRGNYSVTFGSNQIAGVETLRLLSARDAIHGPVGTSFSYNVTTSDANLAAGVQMTIDGAPLRGSETLTFNGSAETDGSFRVFGGYNGDTIAGGGGADIIQANGGADNLTGNGGADIFRYVAVSDSRTATADQILDFATGDRIDLAGIDARTNVAGNDAFAWIGAGAFTGQSGQLRATAAGNVWTVQGDTDGNGVADFQIVVTVTDNHPLGAGDFFL